MTVEVDEASAEVKKSEAVTGAGCSAVAGLEEGRGGGGEELWSTVLHVSCLEWSSFEMITPTDQFLSRFGIVGMNVWCWKSCIKVWAPLSFNAAALSVKRRSASALDFSPRNSCSIRAVY
ncbi:hypothetical protein KFK09_021089 [Dendrobium nobile]|uniref:Uncharacterized protein n=1 Tax=Dendrobium nobile TaxID=94219 RepID=A0A8T3AP66_DENNO|nr:hypothetical protein KFK09_021089 [Dendrobium nobile]